MATSILIISSLLLSLSLASSLPFSFSSVYNRTAGISLPALSFNSAISAAAGSDCNQDFSSIEPPTPNLKLRLSHNPLHHPNSTKRDSVLSVAHKDLTRIHLLFRRASAGSSSAHNASVLSRSTNHSELAGRVIATINSGVSLGSGEYFINAFVGTPPRHYSLILDTGSDLNWIQCLPCLDCFEQHGPVFDPAASASYRTIPCGDPRCGLVTPPDPARPCAARGNEPPPPCQYFYWYGDRSNTTGDLAVETFTVNLTSSESRRVDDVIFGCGHWNRGLFHGAAGLLGLGRGPLSFASQLREVYGHTFSYCLVDRNSDLSVSSKLVFGEDQSLSGNPNLNYTAFVAGPDNKSATDTFYYVRVKSVKVGGEALTIPAETWELRKDGGGGTIIDSGTTLSYFAEPAYDVIRDAFLKKVKYPLVEDFPVLNPCYNVTGVASVEMPGLSIEFADGAAWDFPVENYFIRLDPEEIMCLAILGTPRSAMSIIGNYQQQNFHMVYDTKRSRLGFAPMRCAHA